jgi:hypothetical protein
MEFGRTKSELNGNPGTRFVPSAYGLTGRNNILLLSLPPVKINCRHERGDVKERWSRYERQ